GPGPDPGGVVRLAQGGAQAGLAERVRPVVAMIPDIALRNRAQLELLRAQLAASTQMDADALAAAAKEEAQPALLECRARHAARHGNASEVLKTVAAWDPENLRPFGYIAVALGLQDVGK